MPALVRAPEHAEDRAEDRADKYEQSGEILATDHGHDLTQGPAGCYTRGMSEIAALLGRVVAGKFAIEEHVGGGAMGEVFRARHVVLDTAIALKIMRPDIAKDPMFKQRFYREAKAASRLDHPNSVRVIDFGVEPDGLVYLAMEFLHGRDLLSVLREEWPFPDSRIVDLLVQTLGAVAVAHDLGIVHRDLKPENIMISRNVDGTERAIVMDFGLAKERQVSDEIKKLTATGIVLGTPEFMSPEQLRGKPLDPRTDVYSLGLIAYEMLTGKLPFIGRTQQEIMIARLRSEPQPIRASRPDLNFSAGIEKVLLRSMEREPAERYQTAPEFAAALGEAAGPAKGNSGVLDRIFGR